MNRLTINLVRENTVSLYIYICGHLPGDVDWLGSDYSRFSDIPDYEPAFVKLFSDLA